MFRREASKVRCRISPETIALERICEQLRKGICESLRVTIRKRNATRTDGFRQAARCRTDHNATAGNPFQSNDPKWLLPARWHNQDLMVPQEFRQLLAAL